MVGEHSCSFKDIRFPIAKGVILRYSRSTENGAPSSHIHGKVHSLNSRYGPP